MKKQPNKKLIGAFILSGLIAFIVIIMISLGLGLRNGHKNLYVMYFHESIKGLGVGAPVVLNGVEVGKVVKIEIVPNPATHEFNIPVYISFNDMHKTISQMPDDADWTEENMIQNLLAQGLHAHLISQNLLTGQLMIELDIRPAKVRITQSESGGIIEIPTALSPISALSENVQAIPFREVVENLNQTLNDIKDVLTPAAQISKDLAKKSAVTVNNFNQAVQDVSRAANSLRSLAEFLEQHPESLLRGK